MVTLTETAAKKVTDLRLEEGKPDWGLRVRIVDESPPPAVNLVPSKFLPRFPSVERALAELEQLASRGGGSDYVLRPVPV